MARPTRPEQKAATTAGHRWRRRLGAERPGLGGAPYSAGAEGGSGGWEQSGRALAARPTRPEQKAAAATGRSWRRRLGAEGGGGGWEPGPKNRVAGKEENILGSIYGGI
jgi:hypothetical protein